MVWPNKPELTTAKALGHEPFRYQGAPPGCSCGFRPTRPSIPSDVQVANHIWTLIHEAKEMQAERFNERLCPACKGSGIAPWQTSKPCSNCSGQGATSDDPVNPSAIARDQGHHPVHLSDPFEECICGWNGESWKGHAHEVADATLRELQEFEQELRNEGQ